MTGPTVVLVDAEADGRWRAWQARGFTRDRRRARIAGWVMTALALALAAWSIVAIVSA